MINNQCKFHSLVILTVLAVFTTAGAAPPVRDKILENVSIIHVDGQHIIEVKFPFRVRYQSHFPPDSGTELHIRLQPVRVATSDIEAVFERESVFPRYRDTVSLDEVIYEGDIQTGAQLTLLFTRNVSYEVRPGSDYTKIRIFVLPGNKTIQRQ